jgi:glycosidase
MRGITNPDGWVRLDFPGGWPGDKLNKFTAEGRTDEENEVFNLIRTLANYRKNSSALTMGKFIHYLPTAGVYVYFRYDDKQTIMCVMNTADKEMEVAFENYAERTAGFFKATDVITGQVFQTSKPISIKPMTLMVLELNR